MRCRKILPRRQSGPLDAWIDTTIESNIIPVMRFARTLHRDIDAVRKAIELPWSNGQAEGQVNRLKALKRAMYSRTRTVAGENAAVPPHGLTQNQLRGNATAGHCSFVKSCDIDPRLWLKGLHAYMWQGMTNRHPSDEHEAHEAGAPLFLWVLIGVLAVIEIALSLSEAGYLGSFNWRWSAFAMGAFWQPLFSDAVAELYPGQKLLMFVSYAFLHGSLVHLAINSVILLALGKVAANRIGAVRTLLLLLLSAVGGGLAFGLLSSSNGPMIGASGAVFGLLGLWQAWDYQMRKVTGLPLRPVVLAILGLIAANLVFFVILDGGLAWEAHFGGWLVGWLSARHLTAFKARDEHSRERRN